MDRYGPERVGFPLGRQISYRTSAYIDELPDGWLYYGPAIREPR